MGEFLASDSSNVFAESCMAKDGKAYLSSLRDSRSIYIDGRKVTDVVTDHSFRGVVGTVAGLYDFQAAPENIEQMTFQSPTSGERVNLAWQLPKTYGDLAVSYTHLRAHETRHD